MDHYSRLALGFAVFKKQPRSRDVRAFLGRTIVKVGSEPKYIVCDQGVQFTSSGFKTWCKRRNIGPRFGAVHQYGSIAVIERFIKSLKDEWLRRLIVPLRREAMRKELSVYCSWFNGHRPHQALKGRTPREIYENPELLEVPSCTGPRETRSTIHDVAKQHPRFTLGVSYYEGRRHLPIIELKRAA